MKGIVIWYNIRKGYGFIKGDDGKDVFVHKTDIPFWSIFLTKGEKVQYSVEQAQRGLKAKNITIV